MRILLIGLSVLIAATAIDDGSAATKSKAPAKKRPTWCFTPDPPGNPAECLYYSFEQCQATASGIGGSCDPNYPPEAWGRPWQPPQPQQTKGKQRQPQQQQNRDWRW
jgi:uncharacterized protein DUF3551